MLDRRTETNPEERRRELVARISTSRLFRRSPRQRELLEFLCQRAFEEPEGELKEQDIGVALFGRAANYDTGQDNIVRVYASELRRKLEEHFRTEGAEEELILEIPRGGYTPVVRARAAETGAGTVQRLRWMLGLACGLCLLLGLGCVALWRQMPRGVAPASALWKQFFSQRAEADLIVADSCLSLLTELVGPAPNLQDYIGRSYLLNSVATRQDPEQRRMLERMMTRRYTSIADVLTVQRIANHEALAGKSVTIYYARDYPSQRLQTMNVVLVGSKKSNPWVEAYEPKMNFRVEYDKEGRSLVRNRAPREGEPAFYQEMGGQIDSPDSLAVVAYVPNLRGTAEAVILAGTGSVGTAAAGEAFVSEAGFERIRRALGSRGRVPHFEAVLRTRSVGSSVSDIEVVAVRTVE